MLAVVCVGLAGCADRAWHATQVEDTAAAYARFLRENPNSAHRASAQEHLEFQKVRRDLSLEGYDAFRSHYPDSELSAELFSLLEPQYFERTRAAGTPEAYEDFLADFPEGSLSARARGNRAYLESSGFGARAVDLATFAEQYPESDFASEALRSADLVELTRGVRFKEVRLAVELDPGVGEPEKLRARFTQFARIAYARAGLELRMDGPQHPTVASQKSHPATLVIRHKEYETLTRIEGGDVARPGMSALTTVLLQAEGFKDPIFEREFRLRVDRSQHVDGSSVLSSTAAGRYWDEFFVPIVRSPTSPRVRALHQVESGSVVDVDATFDRAVILFEDGRVQLLELSNPDRPVWLGDYRRTRDLKQWSGVKILGEKIVIFGEEGIELVSARGAASGSKDLGRDRIGGVRALAQIGSDWVLGGPAGLRVLDPETGELEDLLDRPIFGLGVRGDTLVFTDGEGLFVSTIPLLREERVSAHFRLGRELGLTRIRTFDGGALAVGAGGVVVIRIPHQGKPEVVAKFLSEEVGVVHDGLVADGRIFLIGKRGLQFVEGGNNRVIDSADVEEMSRVAVMGRHLIASGNHHIQVVDLSDWTPPLAHSPASAW